MADVLRSLTTTRRSSDIQETTERQKDRAAERLLREGDAPVNNPKLPDYDPRRMLPGETPEQHEERIVTDLERVAGRPMTVEERRQVAEVLAQVREVANPVKVEVPDWNQPYTLADLEKLAGTPVTLDDEAEREEIDDQLTNGSPDLREEVAYNFFPNAPWWKDRPLTPEEQVAARDMARQQEVYQTQLRRAKQAAKRRQTLVKKGFTTGLLGLGDDDQYDWAQRVKIDDRPAAEIKQEIAAEKETDALLGGEDATDLFGKI